MDVINGWIIYRFFVYVMTLFKCIDFMASSGGITVSEEPARRWITRTNEFTLGKSETKYLRT